jgi:hypothetical protein
MKKVSLDILNTFNYQLFLKTDIDSAANIIKGSIQPDERFQAVISIEEDAIPVPRFYRYRDKVYLMVTADTQ